MLDPAWIALIATICGGVGLKVTEHWLSKGRVKIDDAAMIRGELRSEVDTLRLELKHADTETDKWREDYYDLRDKYNEIAVELKLEQSKHKKE